MVHLHSGPSVLCPDCLLPSPPCGATGTGPFRREPSNAAGGTFTHERNRLHGLLRRRTICFAGCAARQQKVTGWDGKDSLSSAQWRRAGERRRVGSMKWPLSPTLSPLGRGERENAAVSAQYIQAISPFSRQNGLGRRVLSCPPSAIPALLLLLESGGEGCVKSRFEADGVAPGPP